MLVKFHSSTSGEILMFAETARTLLGVLKKDCGARGVITLEELPDQIARLRAAIERGAGQGQPPDQPADDEELPVGFRQRAVPFLELLERTQRREGYVLWEAPGDFAA